MCIRDSYMTAHCTKKLKWIAENQTKIEGKVFRDADVWVTYLRNDEYCCYIILQFSANSTRYLVELNQYDDSSIRIVDMNTGKLFEGYGQLRMLNNCNHILDFIEL